MAGRLIAAQEVERARLARDLHDDVSQQIAALSISLSGLKRHVAKALGGTDAEAEVVPLQNRAEALAESVRRLSHDLHPDVLRHAGLAASLRAYCSSLVSPSHELSVTCNARGNFDTLDHDAAVCLYRIAQEALHNVVKHADARHAEVLLAWTPEGAELTVSDDGKGFDIQVRRSGTGLGLVSITERARLAGGPSASSLPRTRAPRSGSWCRSRYQARPRSPRRLDDSPAWPDACPFTAIRDAGTCSQHPVIFSSLLAAPPAASPIPSAFPSHSRPLCNRDWPAPCQAYDWTWRRKDQR